MFIVGLIGVIYWTIGKLEVVVATIQENRIQKKELQVYENKEKACAAYKVEIKLKQNLHFYGYAVFLYMTNDG